MKTKTDYAEQGYVLAWCGRIKSLDMFRVYRPTNRFVCYQAFLGEHAVGNPYRTLSAAKATAKRIG